MSSPSLMRSDRFEQAWRLGPRTKIRCRTPSRLDGESPAVKTGSLAKIDPHPHGSSRDGGRRGGHRRGHARAAGGRRRPVAAGGLAPRCRRLRHFPLSGAAMPRKIAALVKDLERAGFVSRGGRGSHRNFRHPKGQRVTISGSPGDDAKP